MAVLHNRCEKKGVCLPLKEMQRPIGHCEAGLYSRRSHFMGAKSRIRMPPIIPKIFKIYR